MLQSVTNALRLQVESDSWGTQSANRYGLPRGQVTHGSEESVKELGRVGDEVLVILEDGPDGEDGVLAHERVSMFLRARSAVRSRRLASPFPDRGYAPGMIGPSGLVVPVARPL
jgi:hypothetical protein